mgnify:CR=1 FL=1
MLPGQKLDRKLASFCPIFLPIFKDAQHSPKACAGKKNGFGSDLEKNEKEGVVSKGKNEYG